jgi:hypothetical protein
MVILSFGFSHSSFTFTYLFLFRLYLINYISALNTNLLVLESPTMYILMSLVYSHVINGTSHPSLWGNIQLQKSFLHPFVNYMLYAELIEEGSLLTGSHVCISR